MNVFHGTDSCVRLPKPETLHIEFPHSGLGPRDQLGWRWRSIQILGCGIHGGETLAHNAGGGKPPDLEEVEDSVKSTLDLHQHLRVVREFLEEKQQALHRLGRTVAGEAAADEVDFVKHVIG